MFAYRRINFRPFLQHRNVFNFSVSNKVHDPYKILQISRTNNPKDIKNAFYAQTKQYHPDKSPDFKDRYKEIIDAYEILQNPDKKASIDKELDKFISEKTRKQDPQTKWLYKDYDYKEKNDGTQVPPHILKQTRRPPKNKPAGEKQWELMKRYDRILIIVGLVGLYLYVERMRQRPRAKPFSQEEEDAMVELVEQKRKAKLRLTPEQCRKFSIQELSDMERNGEVIVPSGIMITVQDYRDLYEKDLSEEDLSEAVEQMEMSSQRLNLKKIQRKIDQKAKLDDLTTQKLIQWNFQNKYDKPETNNEQTNEEDNQNQQPKHEQINELQKKTQHQKNEKAD